MDCPKCKQHMDQSALVIGGTLFNICQSCIDNLSPEVRENWMLKNIRIAKKAREDGKGKWSN